MKRSITLKGLIPLSLVSILFLGCNAEDELAPKKEKTEEVTSTKEAKEDVVVEKELKPIVSEESKEKDYLFFLLTNNEKLNEYLTEFSDLFNGEVVLDEYFMQRLAVNVAGVQGTGKEIINYEEVPLKYEEVHLYYVESMNYYIEATDDVVMAVADNFAEVYMISAMENLELGGAYLQQSTSLLQELVD